MDIRDIASMVVATLQRANLRATVTVEQGDHTRVSMRIEHPRGARR